MPDESGHGLKEYRDISQGCPGLDWLKNRMDEYTKTQVILNLCFCNAKRLF